MGARAAQRLPGLTSPDKAIEVPRKVSPRRNGHRATFVRGIESVQPAERTAIEFDIVYLLRRYLVAVRHKDLGKVKVAHYVKPGGMFTSPELPPFTYICVRTRKQRRPAYYATYRRRWYRSEKGLRHRAYHAARTRTIKGVEVRLEPAWAEW